MKLSKIIKDLQEILDEHGDLDCWYALDGCSLYQKIDTSAFIAYRCVENGDYEVEDLYDSLECAEQECDSEETIEKVVVIH
ncbi:MAG TPA: hypothetical protein VFC76_01035 [Oscillospiraceae bacterium]|nr:hypothetical protein [Oscillospiraceae bacterium]